MTHREEAMPLERSDLRAHFSGGCKPASMFSIGIEYERFGVHAPAGHSRGSSRPADGAPFGAGPSAGTPVAIEGPVSVTAVLEGLVSRFAWQPRILEGKMIELARGAARITLEPGGQMELSGEAHRDLHGLASELARYVREVRSASEPLGIRWIATGTHPTASVDEIPWLVKKRYSIMREYLPSRGSRATQMMKGTCSSQVNIDFSDEADALEKMRAAMALTPVVAALFANSPITGRRPNGLLTERSAVWLDTDPDRSGPLLFVFDPGASFDHYIDYALSVPMFFVVRGRAWLPAGGMTFGEFLEHGFEGHRPTTDDWVMHLSTLFPDVRLKTYLELRGTDATSPELVLAHAALWKGILYGGRERIAAAFSLLAALSPSERVQLRADIAAKALRATAGGRPLIEIARELIGIAADGLEQAPAGASAGLPSEASYLEPLHEIVERGGRTPAEHLLERFTRSGGDWGDLIEWTSRLTPFD